MHVPELCVKCGVAGMVRRELVIKGSESAVSCVCMKCGHTWQVGDQRAVTREHGDGPHTGRTQPRN